MFYVKGNMSQKDKFGYAFLSMFYFNIFVLSLFQINGLAILIKK